MLESSGVFGFSVGTGEYRRPARVDYDSCTNAQDWPTAPCQRVARVGI